MKQEVTDEIWDYSSNGVRILVVRGDLDNRLSTDLRDHLESALSDSPAPLLVDLEEVTFMDASGVGVLVEAFKNARESGSGIRLVAPSVPAQRLLDLTHTDDVFPIDPDLDVAYARVADRHTEPGEMAERTDAA